MERSTPSPVGGSFITILHEYTSSYTIIFCSSHFRLIIIKVNHLIHYSFVTFNEPVMDHMLLGLKGGTWKAVRSVMTPTFSSGKIKQTLPLVKDCAKNLVTYFNKELDKR